MTDATFLTRDGTAWKPEYAESIDPAKCIGCGRCFKVCSRKVLDLVDRSEQLAAQADEDDDDYDSESEMSVMIVAHPGDCIGCGACGRVCPKGCYSYAA